MRRALALGLILLAGSFTAAVFSLERLPRLVYRPTVAELGKVKPGAVAECTFRLGNTGGFPLIISDIRLTCGCTVADLPTRKIEPDQEVILRIKFTAGERREQVQKFFYLTTTDPDHREVQLGIRVQVDADLDWDPRFLHHDWPQPPGEVNRFKLSAFSDNPIHPTRVYSEEGWLQVKLEKDTGKEMILAYTIPPGSAYHRQDVICVESNSRDFPVARIPVYFKDTAGLVVSPARVGFNLVKGAAAPVRRVTLQRRDGGKVHIVSVEPSRDYFLVTIVQNDRPDSILEVTLKESAPIGRCDGYIRIVTDAGEMNLNIPCRIKADNEAAADNQ